jgi:ATP-dependent DNA helicase RecQ
MLVEKAPEAPALQTPAALPGEAADLYEALRELRAELAREANIPAYVVFSNATLQDMARKKPQTVSQFKKVSGVGEMKAAWYAEKFLARIQAFLEEE